MVAAPQTTAVQKGIESDRRPIEKPNSYSVRIDNGDIIEVRIVGIVLTFLNFFKK